MDYIQIGYQYDLTNNRKEAIDELERIEWPTSTQDDFQQIQIIYLHNTKVICHVGVMIKSCEFENQVYKVAGITGVITHPKYQKKGYALKLLHEAKLLMKAEGVDFSIFTCHEELVSFYQNAGWENTNNCLIGGTKQQPMRSDEYHLSTMMYLISDKAMANIKLKQKDICIELGNNKLW